VWLQPRIHLITATLAVLPYISGLCEHPQRCSNITNTPSAALTLLRILILFVVLHTTLRSQLELLVDHLQAKGERVLVVMPARYTQVRIPNTLYRRIKTKHGSSGTVPRSRSLSPRDLTTIARWRSEGILYESPAAVLDDWLWMYATVAGSDSEGASSSSSSSTDVSSAGATAVNGAAAGATVADTTTGTSSSDSVTATDTAAAAVCNPRVVTNDQMRDHWKSVNLSPRAAARWKTTQVSQFSLEATDFAKPFDLQCSVPDSPAYTVELQRTVSSSSDGSTTVYWHVPLSLESGGQWLCVAVGQGDPEVQATDLEECTGPVYT
jgi:hypothetical protein